MSIGNNDNQPPIPQKEGVNFAEMLDEMEQDGEQQRQAERAKMSLEEVVNLGLEMKQRIAEANDLRARLEIKEKEVAEIKNKKLPQALVDLRLKGLPFDDGTSLELVEVIQSNISAANSPAAHKWLRDKGHGDIIKNIVAFTFGKGEDADAAKLIDIARSLATEDKLHFGEVNNKESIHSSTLKSFVQSYLKDDTKANMPLPTDLFGLYIYQTVEFREPKKKKV